MPERGRIILITGGVRSGKSSRAAQLASSLGGRVFYIATCVPGDEEMNSRVARHREQRPGTWVTVEEALDPVRIITDNDGPGVVFLVDCLTMLISNLMLAPGGENTEPGILTIIENLARVSYEARGTVIIVSNEVGAGIVPADPVSRAYRDALGRANQIIASRADQVVLCIAGLTVDLKNLPG